MIDLYDLVLLIPLVTRQNRVGENVLNVWIVGHRAQNRRIQLAILQHFQHV